MGVCEIRGQYFVQSVCWCILRESQAQVLFACPYESFGSADFEIRQLAPGEAGV